MLSNSTQYLDSYSRSWELKATIVIDALGFAIESQDLRTPTDIKMASSTCLWTKYLGVSASLLCKRQAN